MWFGLYQESVERFALAIHHQGEPSREYTEFTAGDLRASWTDTEDSGVKIELAGSTPALDSARRLCMERLEDSGTSLQGAVMALDTASDSWVLTRLRSDMPGYHVAMAFSFVPFRVTLAGDVGAQALRSQPAWWHIPFELAPWADKPVTWRLLHPALAMQAAAIVRPDVQAGADACAILAARPGLLDYLLALGDTFSLADIEQLARSRQSTPSMVIAQAHGFDGEDRSWFYKVKLGRRAIDQQELLAVTYGRARARHASSLRRRATWGTLTAEQRDFREREIERFAHHLSLLELCSHFGIGLWSCPMSEAADRDIEELVDGDAFWSAAIPPEQEASR
jgi:hypothetical protein